MVKRGTSLSRTYIQWYPNVSKLYTSCLNSCLYLTPLYTHETARYRVGKHPFKLLHDIVPNDLNIQFQDNGRTGIKAVLPSYPRGCRSAVATQYDVSFAYVGPKLWNVLPTYLRAIRELDEFKRKFMLLSLWGTYCCFVYVYLGILEDTCICASIVGCLCCLCI